MAQDYTRNHWIQITHTHVELKDVTELTSHMFSGRLNKLASLKVETIDVTCAVVQFCIPISLKFDKVSNSWSKLSTLQVGANEELSVNASQGLNTRRVFLKCIFSIRQHNISKQVLLSRGIVYIFSRFNATMHCPPFNVAQPFQDRFNTERIQFYFRPYLETSHVCGPSAVGVVFQSTRKSRSCWLL